MNGLRTRGHPSAVAVVRRMIATGPPHAILLAGPAGVGKATLALDVAAGLLCLDPDPAARPCGSCRGCRQLAGGNHPDLRRLAPSGPGGQVRIGAADHPEPGTVRHLIAALALLPVEGGHRVAIVDEAHRLNEDAQEALLKTLEEPPAGVVIILAASDEDRLLPTVRSRCVRIRLGTVGSREIEALLGELGLADPPTAARLARLAGGRPGLAVDYASAPAAVLARDELARGLIDLASARTWRRLAAVRDLQARAAELVADLGREIGSRGEAMPAADPSEPATEGIGRAAPPAVARAAAPADRRAAAAALVAVWRDLARDLAVVARDGGRWVRDPALLEELASLADRTAPGGASAFLVRLGRADELLEGNANPELLLDVLALAWPQAVDAT